MRSGMRWAMVAMVWAVAAQGQQPVLRYGLDEGAGELIQDSSGLTPPIDLTVAHPGRIGWSATGLALLEPTVLGRVQAPWRVNQAIRQAGELSLSVWLAPQDWHQGGPARVVSLAPNSGQCNLMLGQDGGAWEARLRVAGPNGQATEQRLRSAAAQSGSAGQLTHAVYTRTAEGTARIYVDGVLTAEQAIPGSLHGWDFGYEFCLANEVEESRTWLGELHQVAVYELALGPAEVMANYEAGGELQGETATAALALPPLLLYTFEEGEGELVRDRSGTQPPVDLSIEAPDRVAWSDGKLTILSETRVRSGTPPLKLISACGASGEITIEAWFKPANLHQGGPARIVSLSKDGGTRNFTLAQERDAIDVRLRTDSTGINGSSPSTTAPAVLGLDAKPGKAMHVAFVRGLDGQGRLYVDGVLAAEGALAGDLAPWDDDFPISLGNEASRDRPWLGQLYAVELYAQAMTPEQITALYAAGP